jgi:carbon monoxide dehydrogenase subunit G
MRLENSFQVPAAPETAWSLLLDVPRVVPCMPGAALTETVDDSNWKARLNVKLGPISLSFATDVKLEEADEAARRVRLSADARELRGRGAARATIESSLAAVDGGTRVDVVTDLSMSGAVAQYGRGLVQDVSSQLLDSFAGCLRAQLSTNPDEGEAALAAQAKPVSGLSLAIGALRRAIARLFGRRKH